MLILYFCFQSFYDVRGNIRDKFRRIRNHANRTGGGEPIDLQLDAAEEMLLSVMPPEQVDGHSINEGGFSRTSAPTHRRILATVSNTHGDVSLFQKY